MKERSILMQGAMVRATRRWMNPKTQTRRALKEQPSEMHWTPECDSMLIGGRMDHEDGVHAVFEYTMGEEEAFPCPYGGPGDRLWVRETWSRIHPGLLQHLDPEPDAPEWRIVYRADGEPVPGLAEYGGKWHPSIHMFRHDSRILLEIVSVRVERLLRISEEDAIAEGAVRNDAPGEEWDGTYLTQRYIDGVEGSQNDEPHGCARDWYREVWEGINGAGSWALNPWVWVVEFKKV